MEGVADKAHAGAWPRDEIDLAELDAGASSGAARVFAFGQGGRDDANERGPGVVQQFGWSRGPPLQNEVPLEEEDIFELLGARDAARRAKVSPHLPSSRPP